MDGHTNIYLYSDDHIYSDRHIHLHAYADKNLDCDPDSAIGTDSLSTLSESRIGRYAGYY